MISDTTFNVGDLVQIINVKDHGGILKENDFAIVIHCYSSFAVEIFYKNYQLTLASSRFKLIQAS